MTTTKNKSPRHRALKKQGLLNSNADLVKDQRFHQDDFFDPEDFVQVRYEMLRSVKQKERRANDAAFAFGVSRATFYQAQTAFEQQGIVGLIPRKRGPRSAHKLTDQVITFVKRQLEGDPSLSSAQLAKIVGKQYRISVHARSIERALQRQKKKPQRVK